MSCGVIKMKSKDDLFGIPQPFRKYRFVKLTKRNKEIIRQQTAQEIFKDLERDTQKAHCWISNCIHYNKIKQKYLGDKE